MTAERGRAAGLDRRHHLELAEAQVAGMGRTPGGPLAAEDIGDLERRRTAAVSRRDPRPASAAEPVERTRHRADRLGGDAGVERGRIELGVPEQNLDDADVDILLQQVGGEAVAQRVRASRAS